MIPTNIVQWPYDYFFALVTHSLRYVSPSLLEFFFVIDIITPPII